MKSFAILFASFALYASVSGVPHHKGKGKKSTSASAAAIATPANLQRKSATAVIIATAAPTSAKAVGGGKASAASATVVVIKTAAPTSAKVVQSKKPGPAKSATAVIIATAAPTSAKVAGKKVVAKAGAAKAGGAAAGGATAGAATGGSVTRGASTLVLKEVGGIPGNECLTFRNNGEMVDAACVNTAADRQVTPSTLNGANVLLVQRSFTPDFRPDLANAQACVGFNGTTFLAQDCAGANFAPVSIVNNQLVSGKACQSGHDGAAQLTVDPTGAKCVDVTSTTVAATAP